MIWLNPAVLFGLAALAAPIVIHILVQRRAERFPFPTLRFLKPTRLAAIRRHLLEDASLLAVRVAILAAAVGALAGPLVVTSLRRQGWERRIVRAVVVDDAAPRVATSDDLRGVALHRSQQFTGPSLRDAIRRAVAWLEKTPPARRELVVVSPLAIGSVDAADVAAIPVDIGVRFERRGQLPRSRTLAGERVLSAAVTEDRLAAVRSGTTVGQPFTAGTNVEPRVIARELTFAGAVTTVRDLPSNETPAWPIDLVYAPEAKPAVDVAKAAVLDQRVRAPVTDRRVRLVIGGGAHSELTTNHAAAMSQPWMAEASVRIARDVDLQDAASRVAVGLADARFAAHPWQILASAGDGRPLVAVAAATTHLLVVSGADPANIATPILMRSAANAIAPVVDLGLAEVLPIADPQLRQWSRPAPAPAAPTAESLRQGGDDDRRWFWLAALCLIGVEAWMRRARNGSAEQSRERGEETVRVA